MASEAKQSPAREATLFQRSAPQREHLVPGLLGREGVVDGALVEGEAVLGARKHLQLVLDAVLFEKALQLARDVLRHAAVGLGESVVELALDLVEAEMGRVFLV